MRQLHAVPDLLVVHAPTTATHATDSASAALTGALPQGGPTAGAPLAAVNPALAGTEFDSDGAADDAVPDAGGYGSGTESDGGVGNALASAGMVESAIREIGLDSTSRGFEYEGIRRQILDIVRALRQHLQGSRTALGGVATAPSLTVPELRTRAVAPPSPTRTASAVSEAGGFAAGVGAAIGFGGANVDVRHGMVRSRTRPGRVAGEEGRQGTVA